MISRIKSIFASFDLRRLDKRRIDLAMAWAQRHPMAAATYNLGNYLFLAIIRIGLSAVQLSKGLKYRLKRGDNAAGEVIGEAREDHPVRPIPDEPRILLLAEDSIPQCFEYRVRQKLEILDTLGWEAEWLPWSDIERVRRAVHFFDVIVLYRVPGFDAVLSIIKYANSLNKLLIYDLDDLVFDRAQLEKKFSVNRGQLSNKEYRELLTGADLYHKAMSLIPYCIASTEPLRKQVEKIENVKGFVLPNGISTALASETRSVFADKEADAVVIFYGSGTKTHDADFLLITPVLLDLLAAHSEVKLVITGPVQTDPGFRKFEDRVVHIEFLEYSAYLEVLAYTDINIAPLEPGVFADCKSEIKWLEAGMLGVPSVVSGTHTYKQIIEQGETGFLADSTDEWKSTLSKLITRADLRQRVGQSAKARISGSYGHEQLGRRLREIVDQCIDQSPCVQRTDHQTVKKHRLLLVNTLYLPQAMGGATRIVKYLVDGLLSLYGDQYEVRVFTCDIWNTQPYQVREFVHQGTTVTSISVPMRPNLERSYEDDSAGEIFRRAIDYFQADIVHFHSIQRLTASMLLAAEISGVPYLVTLHDSWWISDHPFMIADNGQLLPQNVSNPLVANKYSADLNATVTRNRYLRQRLSGAAALIAVSPYQRDLYRGNGYEQTKVIENGVARPTNFCRNQKEKLVLGYAGGISIHKGYYFLKDNIERAALNNIEVVLVDLFSRSPATRSEKWGHTEVKIYPKFDFSRMGEFYSLIDVLVVPSLWPESFGLVAREASLLGLWVVTSDAGGLSGTVIENKSGHSFAPGDSRRFQEILRELDFNRQKYKRPVPQQVISMLNINTVEQNVDSTHQLYQQILSRLPD